MYWIALLFILLGVAIKYCKMYFLIAGYNTMPAKEKAKYNIEGIATLFKNVMFIMAALILSGSLISYCLNFPEIEGYIFFPTFAIGLLWLIIGSNSKKYRSDR